MKELIEYCEALMDDDDVQLTDKSNGELQRWIFNAKRDMQRAVVVVPLSDYVEK